jgi:iron complex transport system substrate-binding protein
LGTEVAPVSCAVHEGRVFLTDGNQYFNRPGPRLVESLEIFHPDRFEARHRGSGWQPLGAARA